LTRYPLLFGFGDLVAGKGFVAGVTVHGRALLVDEGDGFWMYGVNPGGIAAGGRTSAEAQAEFRVSYRSFLFDVASAAESYDAFEREVSRFFQETNEPTAAEWLDAVADVRQGRVQADWLLKQPADSRIGIEIIRLEHPEPSMNELDQAVLAA
jgi:hypothetical protein